MVSDFVGKECPFCLNKIEKEEKVVICSSCKKPHHLVCWEANKGCTSWDCNGKPLNPDDKVETPVSQIPYVPHLNQSVNGKLEINKNQGSQFDSFFSSINSESNNNVTLSDTSSDADIESVVEENPDLVIEEAEPVIEEVKLENNEKPLIFDTEYRPNQKVVQQYDGSRFEILYEAEESVLQKDSNVLIENVTLIKDHNDDQVYARCDFRSITEKSIKALMLKVIAYDIWGNEIKGIPEYQMLDLRTKYNSLFGQTNPILLPDNTSRKAEVRILKELYEDGIKDISDEYSVIWQPEKLIDYLKDRNLVEQYEKDTGLSSNFVPCANDSIWRCTCGAINRISSKNCISCNADKDILFNYLNPNELKRKSDEYLRIKREKEEEERRLSEIKAEEDRRRRAEEEERLRIEREEKARIEREEREERQRVLKEKIKKYTKRALAIGIPAVSVLIIALAVYIVFWHIVPASKYSKAVNFYQSGNYSEAYDTFSSIKKYKNSEDWIMVSSYKFASELMDNEEYSRALEYFEAYPDYSDTEEKIEYCRNMLEYNSALACIENGQYDEAIQTLESLEDFEDSKEQIKNAYRLIAKDYMDNGEYEKAIEMFSKAGMGNDIAEIKICYYKLGLKAYNDGDYGIAFDYFNQYSFSYKTAETEETYYLCAEGLSSKGKYEEAAKVYKYIKAYKDSKEKYKEAYYQYGNQCINQANYLQAEKVFYEISDYNDSKDKLTDARYNIAKNSVASGDYSKAVMYFGYTAGYKDSNELIKEAKYSYIINNKNNTDYKTADYLKELKGIGYKDTATIYKDLYSWKITNVYFNTSSSSTKACDSISKYSPVYCHFTLSGGAPGDEIYVYNTVKYPDGEYYGKQATSWKMRRGDSSWWGWEDGLYNEPYYGKSGTLKFTFYDENGNVIGEGSVRITN